MDYIVGSEKRKGDLGGWQRRDCLVESTMLTRESENNWKGGNLIRELGFEDLPGGIRTSTLAYLISQRKERIEMVKKRVEELGPKERFLLRKKKR